MQVITTGRPGARQHHPADGDTPRPYCQPNTASRYTYKVAHGGVVDCRACRKRPGNLEQLASIAETAYEAARAQDRIEREAWAVIQKATPGSPEHAAATLTWTAARAAYQPAHLVWYTAAAAYITADRAARAAGHRFPEHHIEKFWSGLSGVLDALARVENANPTTN